MLPAAPMTESQFDFRPILTELDGAAADLRQTLRAAIEQVLPEGVALSSRSCADALGIDKTLGWFCTRIATVADVAATLGALPGRAGWSKVLRGLRHADCPSDLVEASDAAFATLYERMHSRGLDRVTIRSIASGRLNTRGQADKEARLRRQQYESARLIWGVSREASISAYLVAPSRIDPSQVDLVQLAFSHDLRRHRVGPPWNIYASAHSTRDPSKASEASRGGSLDADSGCPLLPEFTSMGAFGSELLGSESGSRWLCDFADRSPKRKGPLQAAFGEVSRAIGSRWQASGEPPIALGRPMGVPTGITVFDVMLHREIALATQPYAALYATIVHDPNRFAWPDRTRLPMASETTIVDSTGLPSGLRSVSAPYRRMLAVGAEALGAEPDAFTIHRTVKLHQPIPTTMVVRFNLAENPND